jgi:hypothetical protein
LSEAPCLARSAVRLEGESADWKLARHKPYVYVNVKYFVAAAIAVLTAGHRKAAKSGNGGVGGALWSRI